MGGLEGNTTCLLIKAAIRSILSRGKGEVCQQ